MQPTVETNEILVHFPEPTGGPGPEPTGGPGTGAHGWPHGAGFPGAHGWPHSIEALHLRHCGPGLGRQPRAASKSQAEPSEAVVSGPDRRLVVAPSFHSKTKMSRCRLLKRCGQNSPVPPRGARRLQHWHARPIPEFVMSDHVFDCYNMHSRRGFRALHRFRLAPGKPIALDWRRSPAAASIGGGPGPTIPAQSGPKPPRGKIRSLAGRW
jgi:hypothetical protein